MPAFVATGGRCHANSVTPVDIAAVQRVVETIREDPSDKAAS